MNFLKKIEINSVLVSKNVIKSFIDSFITYLLNARALDCLKSCLTE